MHYYSTNQEAPYATFREAVLNGLAPDGGLYLPEALPGLPEACKDFSHSLKFNEVALHMMRPFIENEIDDRTLETICNDAFDFPVKLAPVTENIHSLELFWGPTFAFKDFGARFLARVMNHFACLEDRHITILVATSGDTGSAVAHGFAGMDAVDVVLLYPSGRVSPMQEKQLTTLGGNVKALEVKGTFDDCQAMVKEAFADGELRSRRPLGSANSINIGRLLPQSVYYVYACRQLNFQYQNPAYICVPSGNFGNVTGAVMARIMGLAVPKIIVGTNINDVVPKYLENGEFVPKQAKQTPASAMDVGNPSNFARILELFEGSYQRIARFIRGYSFTSQQIYQTILQVQKDYDYLLDPHSAVGFAALSKFLEESAKGNVTGFFSATAHPGKFSEAILEATGHPVEIPAALAEALKKEKKATLIDNNYHQLKNYLLDS